MEVSNGASSFVSRMLNWYRSNAHLALQWEGRCLPKLMWKSIYPHGSSCRKNSAFEPLINTFSVATGLPPSGVFSMAHLAHNVFLAEKGREEKSFSCFLESSRVSRFRSVWELILGCNSFRSNKPRSQLAPEPLVLLQLYLLHRDIVTRKQEGETCISKPSSTHWKNRRDV